MSNEFVEAIKQIQHDRGISEDLVLKTVEEVITAAYKKRFGTDENAVIKYNEAHDGVLLFARKQILTEEDMEDPVIEIPLEEAREYNEEAELGDELLIELDLNNFDRGSVFTAKQRARQDFREIQKDTLYSEFRDKVGELVIGYYQRERNGNIYVDLGKAEGILPKRLQSPREIYRPGDRIKSMIAEVNKNNTGLQIVLSRTHTELVRKIFEMEVPEIYDNFVEIHKIVREAGYRTKIAVMANRDDIDPVGACVGVKGARIQSVVRELEGEKIDILKYDPDPAIFIKNALSPAQVDETLILDGVRRQAMAVVSESQLSLAIGKQGLNVRLANRLTDWSIDVKTTEQAAELDIARDSDRVAADLFTGEDEEITKVSELPGISERLVESLDTHGLTLIEDLVSLPVGELKNIEGLTEDDIITLQKIIEDNVEIVESSPSESEEQDGLKTSQESDEIYECPECQGEIKLGMEVCPHCGVGLSFEEE